MESVVPVGVIRLVRLVILPTDKIWEELMQLLMLDMLHSKLIDDGYAINGSGVAIDFDEIYKAEKMYDKEKESH